MRVPIPPRRPARTRAAVRDVGPFAPVWRRMARLAIEIRNDVPSADLDAEPGIALVPCGSAAHRARPAGDRLELLDHDLEAELALLALGGELPTCLIHAALWDEGLRSEEFLVRWAEDVEEDGLLATEEDWRGNFWEAWPSEPPAARVLFGPSLQRALAVAVAQRATTGDSRHSFALDRAVQRRARRSFVASLASVSAHRRPDALVPIRISVGGPVASIEGRLAQDASEVDLHLPATWLETVWASGGPLWQGRFVVARSGGVVSTVAWRPTGAGDREHRPVIEVHPGSAC